MHRNAICERKGHCLGHEERGERRRARGCPFRVDACEEVLHGPGGRSGYGAGRGARNTAQALRIKKILIFLRI
jgi:hypothetical protein